MTSPSPSVPATRATKAAAAVFIAVLGFAFISVPSASAHWNSNGDYHSNSSSNGHYSYDSNGNAYWSSSSNSNTRNDRNRNDSSSWNRDGRGNDWNRDNDNGWNNDWDSGDDNDWNHGNSGNSCRSQGSSYSVNGYYSYDSHGVAHWNADDSRSSNRCD